MEIGSCADQVVGADLEAKMSALASLGYDFIEPTWRDEDLPRLGESYGDELQKLGERTGCPVRSVIFGTFLDIGKRLRAEEHRDRELEDLLRACQTLAAAGGNILLLPNYSGDSAADYDALYTQFLRAGAERAAPLGVTLAIEHIPASKYRNTAVQVFELVEMVDRKNVGIYFDIANGLYIGDEPLESAPKVASRVVQFHVKPYKDVRSLEAMPLQEVKALFEAAGFLGRVATEIDPAETSGTQTNGHLAAALATLRQKGY